MNTWMVRSNAGELFDDFIENGIVALGWSELGDLTKYENRNSLVNDFSKIWSEETETSILVCSNMLFRFLSEIRKGDSILTYHPKRRIYAYGVVVGDYEFNEEVIAHDDESWAHIRRVDWKDFSLSRDLLPKFARNSLGSTLTIFRVPEEVAAAINAVRSGENSLEIQAGDEAELFNEDGFRQVEENAIEKTKDLVAAVDWSEMQEIVAGLLRALGYRTRISPEGPDRGKDIVASPDGFGFEDPRIIVEVKHRPGTTIGGPDIRSFLGGRQAGDKGLFVSTGGFTKDAQYEAERSNVPLALMTLEDLVEALVEHYDKLDEPTKQLVPLRKIYWPAS